MTATEEFRRLLSERDVEWMGTEYTEPTDGNATNTSLGSEHHDAAFCEYVDGNVLRLFDLTPEQAIVATLGRWYLHVGMHLLGMRRSPRVRDRHRLQLLPDMRR